MILNLISILIEYLMESVNLIINVILNVNFVHLKKFVYCKNRQIFIPILMEIFFLRLFLHA